MRTVFEENRNVLLAGAREVHFPDMAALETLLMTDVPQEQFKGLQEALRLLGQHTGKGAVIREATILHSTFRATAGPAAQKAAVRSLAKEVPMFLASMGIVVQSSAKSPSEQGVSDNVTPATGPTDSTVTPSENKGEPIISSKQEAPQMPNGGNPRKGYTEPQWLRIVYAPQLRHRLIKNTLRAACSALTPPVNLANEERYPHDQDKAKELFEKLGETEFFTMFDEIQNAAIHFFQCPCMEDAHRLNEALIDVRRRGLQAGYLSYFPEDETVIPRILGIENDIERMQYLMTSNDVSQPLVEAAQEAYQRLVTEHLRVTAQRPVLRESTAPSVIQAPSKPVTSGEGGAHPRLPRRVPGRTIDFSGESQNQARKEHMPSGTAIDPAMANGGGEKKPDISRAEFERLEALLARRDQELAALREQLTAAQQTADDATGLKLQLAHETRRREAAEAKAHASVTAPLAPPVSAAATTPVQVPTWQQPEWVTAGLLGLVLLIVGAIFIVAAMNRPELQRIESIYQPTK